MSDKLPGFFTVGCSCETSYATYEDALKEARRRAAIAHKPCAEVYVLKGVSLVTYVDDFNIETFADGAFFKNDRLNNGA